jgi:hypothetical protein
MSHNQHLVDLYDAPKGRPKYFIDSKATQHPKKLAKLSTSTTSPTRIIFNPNTASKHEKRLPKLRSCSLLASQEINVSRLIKTH